ncbi:MAG: hypothetical protein ACJA0N_001096 [Pseudohongiellaceae bacterium]|jgi:hypothetical protein
MLLEYRNSFTNRKAIVSQLLGREGLDSPAPEMEQHLSEMPAFPHCCRGKINHHGKWGVQSVTGANHAIRPL